MAAMFTSEISPAKNRGKLAGMFQFNIVFGILVAYASNWIIGNTITESVAWRWMLGLEAVPALAYTILSLSLPESPRWLITHANERAEGKAIFRQINPEMTAAPLGEAVRSKNKRRFLGTAASTVGHQGGGGRHSDFEDRL